MTLCFNMENISIMFLICSHPEINKKTKPTNKQTKQRKKKTNTKPKIKKKKKNQKDDISY